MFQESRRSRLDHEVLARERWRGMAVSKEEVQKQIYVDENLGRRRYLAFEVVGGAESVEAA